MPKSFSQSEKAYIRKRLLRAAEACLAAVVPDREGVRRSGVLGGDPRGQVVFDSIRNLWYNAYDGTGGVVFPRKQQNKVWKAWCL